MLPNWVCHLSCRTDSLCSGCKLKGHSYKEAAKQNKTWPAAVQDEAVGFCPQDRDSKETAEWHQKPAWKQENVTWDRT